MSNNLILHYESSNNHEVIVLDESIHSIKFSTNMLVEVDIMCIIPSYVKHPITFYMVPAANSRIRCTIVMVVQGSTFATINTEQHHTQEHSHSVCIVRGVVLDDSRITYHGSVYIKPGAHNAIAHQEAKFLLMGDKARACASPHLEIETHDVVCRHGSAMSTISDDHLLLCLARGLSEYQAREMIQHGFLREVVANLSLTEQGRVLDILLKQASF